MYVKNKTNSIYMYGLVIWRVWSNSITFSSRILSHQKHKQNNKDSLSLFSFFFIVYSIYYRHCNLICTVFNILFFHGSSPFHTGTNPFANAFIFRHKEEEQKQENVPTAASNANAKAEAKAEDGANIFVVFMEPDKEPFELQTNRRATSARTIKDYFIILWLFSL